MGSQIVPPNSPNGNSQINPWIVAVAVMFATFMEVLDITVVNVSLPHIAGSLSASVNEATWTLTSYLVANAIVLPLTGWLANYFGRKRLLISSVIGFTVASFLCGLAPNLSYLIVFRIVQGATGGCLQPLSQAVLLEAFPISDRGKAMAFWALGIVVAPMLGPVIGGWLTDNYSWRWVFYVNVPIGIISVVMCTLYLFDPPYIRRRISESVDYWGLGLLAVGIGALQIVLDKGQEADWFGSRWVVDLLIIALVALTVFVIHELRSRHPVVDLRVLKTPTYGTGVLLLAVTAFGLFGSMVMIPIMLQTLLGYPAVDAGIAMFPRGLGAFLMMPVVGVLLGWRWIDSRKLVACGAIGVATAMYFLSRLNLNMGYWDIFWPQLLQGLMTAWIFVPLTTITMDPIPLEGMGNATSIFNLMRNIGGSIGIATVTTLQVRSMQAHINLLGANVTPFNSTAQSMVSRLRASFIAKGSDPVTATHQAYRAVFNIVERQASMISFNEVFTTLSLIFLGLLPLILILRRPHHERPTATH